MSIEKEIEILETTINDLENQNEILKNEIEFLRKSLNQKSELCKNILSSYNDLLDENSKLIEMLF